MYPHVLAALSISSSGIPGLIQKLSPHVGKHVRINISFEYIPDVHPADHISASASTLFETTVSIILYISSI